MSRLLLFVRRSVDAVLRNRTRLPRFANRLIDHIADSPDSALGRLAARSLGPVRAQDIPAPTLAPEAAVRVYVGPTNYAEQGWAWARALDAVDGVAARNMAVDVPGGFSFRADTLVPVPVYASSLEWQNAELAAVGAFSHVLVEAERALFGRLFSRDIEREARHFVEAGLSTAYICHGADIRLPSRHVMATEWSPFGAIDPYVQKLQRDAEHNRAVLDRLGRPVFVSTPDLLADVPYASWCPVVVDFDRWSVDRTPPTRAAVRVAHVPSKSALKGTPLVEPVLLRLAGEGFADYEPISGVPSERMPQVYGAADIVLDQFRLGSYGVSACEAMASGAVVVGHVTDAVRAVVREQTGLDLPIVEATPSTLDCVLRMLLADADLRRDLGAAGRAFTAAVHDGRWSARVLMDDWIAS